MRRSDDHLRGARGRERGLPAHAAGRHGRDAEQLLRAVDGWHILLRRDDAALRLYPGPPRPDESAERDGGAARAEPRRPLVLLLDLVALPGALLPAALRAGLHDVDTAVHRGDVVGGAARVRLRHHALDRVPRHQLRLPDAGQVRDGHARLLLARRAPDQRPHLLLRNLAAGPALLPRPARALRPAAGRSTGPQPPRRLRSAGRGRRAVGWLAAGEAGGQGCRCRRPGVGCARCAEDSVAVGDLQRRLPHRRHLDGRVVPLSRAGCGRHPWSRHAGQRALDRVRRADGWSDGGEVRE